MKILGSVTAVNINQTVASLLKIKDENSFIAIPNTVLDRFNTKKFDIIDSDNELMLVAQSAKAELTKDKSNSSSKEIVS